jgi:hypothetical protein
MKNWSWHNWDRMLDQEKKWLENERKRRKKELIRKHGITMVACAPPS